MPLLDHFRLPLIGRRHWESFPALWAGKIAEQLNRKLLPRAYFAEPKLHLGPNVEIDVATFEETSAPAAKPAPASPQAWTPPRPNFVGGLDLSHLDRFEVLIHQEAGGPQLCAAVELISPANKDRPVSRQAFAVKCIDYLRHRVAVVIVDLVTDRLANMHAEILHCLELTARPAWQSATHLYTAAYRARTVRKQPRLEAWTRALHLGAPLPTVPLWLNPDLCIPLRLEESYADTCASLRISA